MKDENYETTDLYFACVLATLGYKLIGLKPLTNKKFAFNFLVSEDSESPEDLLVDYYDNNLKVDAKTFTNNIKELKNRLYTYQR